ncbi:MAG TPA: Ig-like domain-containing protein [Candidatus Binatia bacterium]|nr:Ig-like domain-containing protein [Candidatus Binatia bacterium]
MARLSLSRWARVVAPLFVSALPSLASAQSAARAVEPVVLTGADLRDWSRLPAAVTCAPYPSGTTGGRDAHNGTVTVPPDLRTGVAIDQIAAFRWDGGGWTEIPVQVDEMFTYCLSNPPSGFSMYSGTDKELTYAWDVESWKKTAGECSAAYPPGVGPTPDPVATLDDDDEIAFMASDAGPQAPAVALPPPGATSAQGIAIVDPLDPSAAPRFVYLVLRPGGSSFTAANGYVAYARDANADEWIDRFSIARDDPEILGVSNTGYGPNLSGTVCRTAIYPDYPPEPDGTPRSSDDRFARDGVTVTTDTYRWRATGRWMVRGIQVAKPGQPGVHGPDLIDRWKGRAFQQSPDSTISLVGFEDEQVNWEANSALLGERAGPVRAIREIWGADSGTNVTKTESFYRDLVTYHYHVRVHPIPPDGLYTSWDYNHGVAARYYNVLKPDGVAIDGVNDDVGNVDGVFGFPAFFDAPDATFNVPSAMLNWEEVSGASDFGSLVYITEFKGATTAENPAVVPYYRDDACLDDGTGDDPVPRPWPGEASTDPRVHAGYEAENGGTPYDQLACDQRQGVWGAHGVHYFFSGDTDNAASPEVLTEIDAQSWQFMVPTAAPTNVGQPYGNVVIAPLVAAATPTLGIGDPAPPTAADATATTDQGVAVDVTLSGTDVVDCELVFSIVTPPAHGSLGAIANQACSLGLPSSDTARVTYTPAPGFSGSDSFTYKVSDSSSDSNVATVRITVKPKGPPTCATGPLAGCRRPTASQKASIAIRDSSVDRNDRLTWKWLHGAETQKPQFGNPLADTDYQLCVFDGGGATIARASAPAGGSCGSRPCWTENPKGFRFKSRQSKNGGPTSSVKLTLRAGADGKAQIVLQGSGVQLGLHPLPASQPVRVQLKNADGACWEAVYAAPATQNAPGRFVDKAD